MSLTRRLFDPFDVTSVFDTDPFFDGNPQSWARMTDFPRTLTSFPTLGTTCDLIDKPRKSMRMKWDMIEKPTEYQIKADLPGMRKENINLEVDEGVLTITAEKKDSTDEEGTKDDGTYVFRERSWRNARRQLRLPNDANENAITATMDHGVLNVHLQKHQDVPPSKKKIEIIEN